MTTYLSEHFTLQELTKSATASRHGIDNSPPEHLIPVMALTCEKILEPVRENFGIAFSPSSGFRCYALEKVICKKQIKKWLTRNPGKTVDDYLDRKQHPKGNAVDFEIPSVSNLEVYNWIKENLIFDQLILEFYDGVDPHSGWVHCSYRKEGNRRQAFEIK